MTQWAEMMMHAAGLEDRARKLRTKALETRCLAEDSGGARCSADALPSHAHRYQMEDFPDVAQP